jgi:hypothetical protein
MGLDLYVSYKMNLLLLFANPNTLTRPPGVQSSRAPRTDALSVQHVIKLCWVRYICYVGTYFFDSNDHVYSNVNGYGYPMGTRYPWWIWVWRNFVPMMGSGYEYESIFFLVGIGMASYVHWVPYPLPSLSRATHP